MGLYWAGTARLSDPPGHGPGPDETQAEFVGQRPFDRVWKGSHGFYLC